MNSLFSIKEKVILLTGGYGILGACMAKHLAREGAYVVILGRNEQKGSALVGEIKAEGGKALFLVSNVLDKALLVQNKQEILLSLIHISEPTRPLVRSRMPSSA